jgi:hypothetical protein
VNFNIRIGNSQDFGFITIQRHIDVKNKLSKSQIEVSILSFGTVAIGTPYGIDVKDTPNKQKLIQYHRLAKRIQALQRCNLPGITDPER